ncbi:MAG: CAP domain-containing protein [Minisyncoccia bacterium]
MKKIFNIIFTILTLVIILGGATYFLENNKFKISFPEIKVENLNQAVVDLKKEVLSPPPLNNNLLKNDSTQNDFLLTNAGILKWTNFYRNQNNLSDLKQNNLLDQVATLRAKDMFEKQYFAHYSNQGIGAPQVAEQIGYEYIAIGENIALGNFRDDKDLVTAWMNSPSHRENILNSKYTEIGIAVMNGVFKDGEMDEPKKVWIAVQIFGKPMSFCQKPDENLKLKIESLKKETQDLEAEAKIEYDYLSQNNILHSREEIIDYNKKVWAYNDLINKIKFKLAELNSLIGKYNLQVEMFNQCISL